MSSPGEFYKSLPATSKAYGTLLFFRFQVWRLITNFFFLGKFSINFGICLLMIARYGVNLEKGPFERHTADFLWMMIFGGLSLLT
ncbi:hypothetical protein LWI28_022021 [Acer negundo]|uniref:Uncharacterized protein n=1 Tax=Acer negundo TaxID=4023 RepID=A0AAD5JAP7_ACENE|nr:hypothetical protein LWI28_022021 [Acer negundo]